MRERKKLNFMDDRVTGQDVIDAATAYVQARRKKLTAILERNKHLSKCEAQAYGDKPCCMQRMEPDGDLMDKSEWCDACKAQEPFNEERLIQSRLAGSALRRLERLINKKQEGMQNDPQAHMPDVSQSRDMRT